MPSDYFTKGVREKVRLDFFMLEGISMSASGPEIKLHVLSRIWHMRKVLL